MASIPSDKQASSSTIYTDAPGSPLEQAVEKVILAVYFVWQILCSLFSFEWSSLYWQCKNTEHLKETPAFFFTSPPLLQENAAFQGSMAELVEAYQELNPEDSSIQAINRELSRGCCYAEALQLVQLVKEKGGPLSKQISTLDHYGSEITQLEMLEVFRPSFERNERLDLITKMESLQPKGCSSQKTYEGTFAESLKTDLEKFEGLVITRLYNKFEAHALLFSIDSSNSRYGFYNPTCLGGYYEYRSLETFIEAITEFNACHDNYPGWQSSFYSTQLI